MYDIIIIGAGVVGAFIARVSSSYQLKVLLLDKENDVGNVTSMANSAIVHSGYDPVPGTNKAKFNVLGNKMFPSICRDLDVRFGQLGSMTIANSIEQIETLKELQKRAKINGVDTILLNKEDTLKLEPHLNQSVCGSLLAPSAGIVDPFNLVVHAVENAVDNGVILHLNEEVINIEKNKGLFIVKTNKDSYSSKVVINAAGLNSDTIYQLSEKDKFSITPRKGEYYVLDHYAPGLVNHVIFPLPSEKGKGILVSPTTSGNYIVGPSSENVLEKDNFDTDTQTLKQVKQAALEMVPSIPFNQSIRVFAGLRATPSTHDFVIKDASDASGLIIVGGIESPGLVSSPAIAEYVIKELVSKHIKLIENPHYNKKIKPYIHPKMMNDLERKELIKANPHFGKIVCNCEQVSLGEIEDCLSRSVPPHSIKALKKRTRAGFGKCQGGFCQPTILNILANHYHIDFCEVNYDNLHSNVLKECVKGDK